MTLSQLASRSLGAAPTRAAALALAAAGLLLAPATASTPVGHLIIAEQVIDKILKDPNADPVLKDILQTYEAQQAFAGGACAPDLDTVSDRAHAEDPKATADKLMDLAQSRLADAQSALANAGTDAQRDAAEARLEQAKLDVAFAYGWRCHAGTDFETHPLVNASGEDYWEDSDGIDKFMHGLWESRQEANWARRYGPPGTLPEFRENLLQEAFGLDPAKLDADLDVMQGKTMLAWLGGPVLCSETQLEGWREIDDATADKSIGLSSGLCSQPDSPFDNSCWDVGLGISVDDFKKFIEDTKNANGGKLPDNFWGFYDYLFEKWQRDRANAAGGGAGGGGAATPPLLPPPLPPGSGSGAAGSSSTPNKPVTLNPFR